MWFRRRQLDEATIARMVETAVARALESRQPNFIDALAAALGKFLESSVESQAKNMDSFSNMLSTVSEIAADRAARALGKRRASAGAKRGQDGRFLRRATRSSGGCPVVTNAALATRADVARHINRQCACHGLPEPALPALPAPDAQANGSIAEQ